MKNFFVYLSFIPWIFYLFNMSKNALKDLKHNEPSLKWFIKNIFKIFRFDTIILLLIYIFFSYINTDASQLWLVKLLLFAGINLYLFINSYYDKNKIKEKIKTDDVSTILILLFITFIPILLFMSTEDYTISYYIMFAYSFFNYLIIYIAKKINDLTFRLVIKHGDKDK